MGTTRSLVVLMTRGLDDERSSVAWSVANGAVACDMEVTVFLTSSAVDWARRGAADLARLNPLDPPVGEMIGNVLAAGGRVLVCPPCAKVRGYAPDDLIPGVMVAGAAAMLEVVRQGAATLSF